MDSEGVSVICGVDIEWTNAEGTTIKKVKHKSATVRLIRNGTREMFVQVIQQKSSHGIKLLVKEIEVLNRFMSEGKASIKFPCDKCIIFLSNAPIASLVQFLKMIFVKICANDTESKENPTYKKYKYLELLAANSKIEEISPATNAEIKRAQEKVSLVKSVTTPSPSSIRKRKIADMSSPTTPKMPRGKKLYIETQKTTEEQQKIINSILEGNSVFFTGSAGTGKSFLLKKIIAMLPPDATAVTASTGVAACHIGGTTLHRFAGIGLGTGNLEECRFKASKSGPASNWRTVKRLIIDEVSMLDGDYFDKIEYVARYIKKNERPFGGIQLILCGDFFQLPPVSKRDVKVKFCFQSEAWSKCIQFNYELKTVYRQKDMEFVNILNSIRVGVVTEEITKALKATSSQKIEGDDILATKLCSHVNEANNINESQLQCLPGDDIVFTAEDSDPSMRETLDRDLPVSYQLTLKVGAQVMLLKNINIESGLANGARGVVVKFKDGMPVVHFRSGGHYTVKVEKWSIKTAGGNIIYRKQIPLKLAWAFSIHKSQGLTLDCVEMSLGRVFDAGQAYVALSRAQSLKTLRVLDFDTRQVWANKDVLKFYQRLQRQLHEMVMIPLGNKRASNAPRVSKKASFKQLVNIC